MAKLFVGELQGGMNGAGWGPERETSGGTLPADAVARAVAANRGYASSLGWMPHFDAIARTVGFTNQSPDEASLARALALWQSRNGLTADGILGPKTWAALRPLLAGGPMSVGGAAGGAPASVGTAGGFLVHDARLQRLPMPPASPIAIDARWSRDRQALGRTYNRLGGLMGAVGGQLGIDVAAVLAVWRIESGGREHTVGRAIIRFENHYLWDHWGQKNPALYDQHFRHGGRAGVEGKRFQGHLFRESPGGAWETVHTGKQEAEYRVLALASRLAGEETALKCISMGGPQIMGASHAEIGYPTARAMYQAFQASERAHVLGFFDFCRTRPAPRKGDLLLHIRARDWDQVARYYNGPANVPTYGPLLRAAYAEATRLPLGSANEWETDPDADAASEPPATVEGGEDGAEPGAWSGDAGADSGGAYAGDGADADAPPPPPPCRCGDPGCACGPSYITRDGYALKIPRWWLDRLRARLPWPDPRTSMHRLAGLARGARRIGTLRSRRSGKGYPVFAGQAGGRRFGIVTKPARGRRGGDIVAVRPVPAGRPRR
jgi:hypothetical protein